jgi:hypothetical protein
MCVSSQHKYKMYDAFLRFCCGNKKTFASRRFVMWKHLHIERNRELSKIHWTEERKEKMRQRMLGKNNPFYGKKHSPETLLHMSINNSSKRQEHRERMKGNRYGEGRKGLKQSDATKEKISKANKGKLLGDNNPSRRPEVREKISLSRRKKIL